MRSVSERPHARFYTRSNCSLCDKAYPILAQLAAEGLIVLETVDIATAPRLTEIYGHRIPVVELSTGHTFEGRISGFRLRRALRQAAE